MVCKQKRKFKATTQSNHTLSVAENHLERCFQALAPNEVWHADITYIPTGEGWLYLAGVKDPFTCEMVGYALGERMSQALVGQALWQAIRYQRPRPVLIHHCDRGSQYCARDYQRLLEQHGLMKPVLRRRHPFGSTLKFFIIAKVATRVLATWPQRCLLKTSANNSGLLETRVSTIARTPHPS